MKNQNRNRFRHARCIRRSRFPLLLLSSALLTPNVVPTLYATETNEQQLASQVASLDTTPVLKSVGIRFVKDAGSDLNAVKSAATLSRPVHSETVPSLVMPKLAIAHEPPVEKKESNPSKVTLNSLTSIPTIKMPPMVASSESNTAALVPNKDASVKIKMASNTKSLETCEKPTAPKLIATETKLDASLEAPSDATTLSTEKCIAGSIPKEDLSSIVDAKHSQSPMEKSEVGALMLSPPATLSTVPTPPTLEPPKPQPAASVKAPLLAGKNYVEEGSRAANVVRIPSMTLSSKSLESVAVTSSVDTPKPIASAIPAPPSPAMPIFTVSSKPEATLPFLNSLPPTEQLAQKTEAKGHASPAEPAVTKTKVEGRVSDHAAAIHQSIREAARLEPKVVAIPASTKSGDWDRSVVSGLKSTAPPLSQTEQETHSNPTDKIVEMAYRDAQNVKLPGSIERVVVSDESICKAMVSDANGIVLLGIGQGKTQIKVWLTSDNHSESRLQQIYVTVREAWEAKAPQAITSYEEATQSLSELFPTAKIAIRSTENGSLTIFGRADSDEQAKQIASLVRKMFLVPVQDRIATVNPR